MPKTLFTLVVISKTTRHYLALVPFFHQIPLQDIREAGLIFQRMMRIVEGAGIQERIHYFMVTLWNSNITKAIMNIFAPSSNS